MILFDAFQFCELFEPDLKLDFELFLDLMTVDGHGHGLASVESIKSAVLLLLELVCMAHSCSIERKRLTDANNNKTLLNLMTVLFSNAISGSVANIHDGSG